MYMCVYMYTYMHIYLATSRGPAGTASIIVMVTMIYDNGNDSLAVIVLWQYSQQYRSSFDSISSDRNSNSSFVFCAPVCCRRRANDREFRDVVFEDVVFDNDIFSLILYLDVT